MNAKGMDTGGMNAKGMDTGDMGTGAGVEPRRTR